eukprot:Seg1260.6_Seg1260.7 transcript_id=Seg1260.6_Seg1260.7/GoldUCD/mRNA.D3Y31 product="Acid-sensing ion channel 1A" protein_id=Seg1260.6_Seg1260.7/GoldUCD/D3Y31
MATRKKTKLEDEVNTLTVHGASRIFSAKSKYARCTWLVLVASTVSFLMYFAITITKKHLSYEVYMAATRKREPFLKLPAITFCNTNIYSWYNYMKEAPVFQKFPENCSMNNTTYFTNGINHASFKFACKTFLGNYEGTTSAVGQDMPLYFRFPQHFSFLPHIYPCYTLKGNGSFVQSLAGERAGIHLILYSDKDDRMPQRYNSPLKDSREGVYVAVHDERQTVHGFEGVFISPGFHTRIALQKNDITRKPRPYPSECVKDGEEAHKSVFPGKDSYENCFHSCYYRILYEKCDSVLPEMRAFMSKTDYPTRGNFSWSVLKNCTETIKDLDYRTCGCRLPCKEEVYSTKVTINPWPQSWQTKLFQPILQSVSGNYSRNFTIHDVREWLIKVSIYYEAVAVTKYEEKEVYPFESILGDFGGQMGLFIGASLLSLAEIAALLWFLLKQWFERKGAVKNNTDI